MKVFITGATGRIGKLLIGELIHRKWSIDAFVLPAEDVSSLEKDGVNILRGDVTDFASVDSAMNKSKPDLIFHLAGYVKLGSLENKQSEESMHDVNVNGTRNVLNVAFKNKVNKLVYISSVAIFGTDTKGPVINELTIPGTNHKGPYGRTKLLAHQEIAKFQEQGMNVLVFIPGIIYGPEFSRTTSLLESVWNGSVRYLPDSLIDTRVPLVFGRDIQQAIFSGIEKDRFGEHYILVESNPRLYDLAMLTADTVGSKIKPKPISYRKAMVAAWLAESISKFTGKTPKITRHKINTLFEQTKDLKYQFEYDNSKAKRELDWMPTSLEIALKRTIECFTNSNSR